MTDRRLKHLRKLKDEDASIMLEWMHDENIVEFLHADFLHKTLKDCQQFIRESQQDKENLHLAVTDKTGTYMGTISLKNVDPQDGTAEFGICLRSAGMGKGLSKAAMEEILSYGFQLLGLKKIYWCVSLHNVRANRFYQKNGYKTVRVVPARLQIRYQGFHPEELLWYCATREEQADGCCDA